MTLTLRLGTLDSNPNSQPTGSRTAGAFLPRPQIDAVPEGVPRPFWSVMVPIHNRPSHHLRETLESVLGQNHGPQEMQIEVIGNSSTTTGDPEAVVRDAGGGRVAFRRVAESVDMVETLNSCIRHATGQWVHILHGDDTVRPGFYDRLRRGITAHPDVGAAVCRHIHADEEGRWIGLSELETRIPGILNEDFARRQLLDRRIELAAFVVRRAAYEELGGFLPALPHCLAWDMSKRVTLRKLVYYEPEPLACHRLRAADSGRLMRTGENVAEERRSIELSCADFPPERARQIRHAANMAAGVRAARRARYIWRTGDRAAAWRQFTEAARCSLAPAVTVRLIYFLLRTVVR